MDAGLLLGNFLLVTAADILVNSQVTVALAAAVLIAALAYMAGEFFSAPTLKGFAKNELYELGVSAVILVIALALIVPNGPFDMAAKSFMLEGVPVDQDHVCPEFAAAHGTIDAGGNWVRNPANPGSDAFAQAGFFLGCRPDLPGFTQ